MGLLLVRFYTAADSSLLFKPSSSGFDGALRSRDLFARVVWGRTALAMVLAAPVYFVYKISNRLDVSASKSPLVFLA